MLSSNDRLANVVNLCLYAHLGSLEEAALAKRWATHN